MCPIVFPFVCGVIHMLSVQVSMFCVLPIGRYKMMIDSHGTMLLPIHISCLSLTFEFDISRALFVKVRSEYTECLVQLGSSSVVSLLKFSSEAFVHLFQLCACNLDPDYFVQTVIDR